MQLALGLIETKGLVGAIEAADAMAKAADVTIIGKEKITAALVTIKIKGEVAAVRSALDAGAAAAQRIGQLVAVHIIPRPDDQIDPILTDGLIEGVLTSNSVDLPPLDNEDEETEDEALENGEIEHVDISQINFDELETLNVHKLRRLARGLEDFPIKGRDISKANRQDLIEHFRTMKK